MTQSTTKKQHYVPQFYLKHFAKDNKCFTILNLNKYIDVVTDMYDDNVLNDDDIEELEISKEKDDFER